MEGLTTINLFRWFLRMRDDPPVCVARRVFVSGCAAGWLAGARWAGAQERPRRPRVAVLVYPRRQEGFPLLESLIAGLREAGWVNGQNIAVELHYAESFDDLPGGRCAYGS